MHLQTVADLSELIGHILIAYTAVAVHERVRKEHKITDAVYQDMRRERTLAFFGILLIIFGFVIRLLHDYMLVQ